MPEIRVVDTLPDELMEQARVLLAQQPNQANVRRAISAAYYALFHLLVRSGAAKWNEPDHHARLSRIFEHNRMREASVAMIRKIRFELNSGDVNLAEKLTQTNLFVVVEAFVELQQFRLQADYDLSKPIERSDAADYVQQAEDAFAAWNSIASERLAQDYLFSLLFKERTPEAPVRERGR